MADLREIISTIKAPTKDDIALVTKAYNYAEIAHKGQKRFSGDPYFLHLTETAKILAEFGMGPITISAGLLHDILEDANVSAEALEKEFGKEILFLVEGVTKLGKLHYHGVKRYTESLRKLFVAISEDLRVLIIKLCDRLHNMRTLQYVRKEKQKRIALETLEIYAPLAYRLGIRKLNRELEDLAFPFVYPADFAKVQALLKKKGHDDQTRLEKFRKSVVKGLTRAGITNFTTDYRVKGLYSLYHKLQRKQWDIENIYDIMAIRIVVKTIEDCYKVLGIIHSIWRPLPNRIKDYIATPKPNGYRGIHTTIFTGDGGIIELQMRTTEMHRDAEFGIASHFEYKEKISGEKSGESALTWFKQLIPFLSRSENLPGKNGARRLVLNGDVPSWLKELANVEMTEDKHDDFIRDIKTDFFENRAFIFTPKGDVVDLPINSSPVDFAYAIHSDVGDHMAGAKVNGKLVSLDTKIKNGDIVEIMVKDSAKPSTKWLDIAKTTVAKRHIKNYLEKEKN